MKKFILIFGIFMTMCTGVSAQGKIIGSYVNTDIIAYINGAPIKSYNINGYTGIIAEDLRDYAFDVIWSEEERTLRIGNAFFPTPTYHEQNLQGGGKITSTFKPEVNSKPIGSFAGNIYSTNIKTYVANEEVKAFNIGGRTIIFIDDLCRFGNVVWHETERKICYDYVEPWNIYLYERDVNASTEENINSFSLDMYKDENGKFVTEGKNLDYLDYLKLSYNKRDGMCFGFSIYQRVLFQTEELHNLLWKVSTIQYDNTVLAENATLANSHIKILINGENIAITKVTQGKGSGHSDFYFWLDSNISKDDINTLSINAS